MSFKRKGFPLRWIELSRKGQQIATFTVRNAYNLLVSSSVSRFLVKQIWMAFVPSKVSFLAWETAWGKVLTLDKL